MLTNNKKSIIINISKGNEVEKMNITPLDWSQTILLFMACASFLTIGMFIGWTSKPKWVDDLKADEESGDYDD